VGSIPIASSRNPQNPRRFRLPLLTGHKVGRPFGRWQTDRNAHAVRRALVEKHAHSPFGWLRTRREIRRRFELVSTEDLLQAVGELTSAGPACANENVLEFDENLAGFPDSLGVIHDTRPNNADHADDKICRHLFELVTATNGGADDVSHAQEDGAWVERDKAL